jgi:uncharacterized membrane protein (UPF0136 family)
MVGEMESASKFRLNSIEIGIMSGLAIMFLFGILERFTHWEPRSCLALAILATWAVQSFFIEIPSRKMAIRGIAALAGLAVMYFTWGLWTPLFR